MLAAVNFSRNSQQYLCFLQGTLLYRFRLHVIFHSDGLHLRPIPFILSPILLQGFLITVKITAYVNVTEYFRSYNSFIRYMRCSTPWVLSRVYSVWCRYPCPTKAANGGASASFRPSCFACFFLSAIVQCTQIFLAGKTKGGTTSHLGKAQNQGFSGCGPWSHCAESTRDSHGWSEDIDHQTRLNSVSLL